MHERPGLLSGAGALVAWLRQLLDRRRQLQPLVEPQPSQT
jgi:hypothetical protein